MDALKNRFRLFMEGIMIMVCPVLLAMVINKVNRKTEGHELVNGITSSIAALTLEAGILPFVGLGLLPECAARYLYGVSKWFVHLGALLLVALAFILLLISVGKLVYVFAVIPFAVLTTWCHWSLQNSPDIDSTTYNGHEVMLENLADFSAAVTGILFLGLEWLALGGQSSSNTAAQGLDRRLLAASLVLGFFTCVYGVLVMLLGTVPPLTNDGSKGTNKVEAANIVLAILTGATVILITSAAVKEMGWCVIAPALATFLTWAFSEIFNAGVGNREEEVAKPASLTVIKVTFTGFFAVSVLSIDNSSLSTYTKAFIMLTSAAVISGIGWRLLTHRTRSSRAVIVAANTASLCAHVSVAIAVLPFAAMAVKGLK